MSGSIGLPELLIIFVLVGLLALPVPALFMLFRVKDMPDLVRVLWVLVILAFPVIGPVAFILSRLVRPAIGHPEPDTQHEKEPRAT